jgi:hypothetical protein
MKKALLVLSFLTSAYIVNIISGCVSTSMGSAPVSVESYGSDPKPNAAPSASSGLDNLKLGVLPDPSLSTEEQKLAGLLARKVKPEFPLKLGVLIYGQSSILTEKNRKELYETFVEKIRKSPDVAEVIQISPSLINSGANIEDIRKLAARFQVSTLLLINDSYQSVMENKEAIITPADIISGNRNWESISNIELFALDILNGVFVYSTSASGKEGDKYNKLNPAVNKDEKLATDSAKEAWSTLSDKVTAQISEFKKQTLETPASPQPSAL